MTKKLSQEQKVFNKAYRGLRSQGFRQSTALFNKREARCAYRGSDGRRCAIGWCVPDRLYSEDMEGLEVGLLLESGDLLQSLGCDEGFLVSLQYAHDAALDPEDMKRKLQRFAAQHNLTIPEGIE